MTNKEEEINSIQYIEDVISAKSVKELVLGQQDKLINSIKMGFKTLFYGKKWIIYIVLALMFLPIIVLIEIVVEGGSLRIKHPDEAFVDVVFDMLFPLIFIFGCLLMSLPLSADEISNHSIELYFVRPIKREVFWLSRWIVVNVAVYCVNLIIYFVYFLFVHAFAKKGAFVGMGKNLHVFGGVAVFLLAATLIYSGTFLLVGMIGNRGLLFSFLLAIFELFFISILFLSDSPYIPQSNLYEIANNVLPDHVDFDTPPENLANWNKTKLRNACIYVTIFPMVVFVVGAFFLRMREIK